MKCSHKVTIALSKFFHAESERSIFSLNSENLWFFQTSPANLIKNFLILTIFKKTDLYTK